METLESIFRKKKYYHYLLFLNDSPPIPIIIGRNHIFTTGLTEGETYDPENACIELFERESQCSKGNVLFINSYYDEPGTRCNVREHTLMFRLLKLIAIHIGHTTIELIDGSRKRTTSGCEWDLRILNRLYKGEDALTFYEKHGFVPCVDVLSRDKPPIRLERILGQFSEIYQTYLAENRITTIEQLATHMYALCNREDFSSATIKGVPLSHFFQQLSKEIKQTIAATRGRSEEEEVVRKENMTYFFKLHPSIHSRCELRKAVFPIREDEVDPIHGTGTIHFILDPAEFAMLDRSHVSGGKRKTKRRKNCLL